MSKAQEKSLPQSGDQTLDPKKYYNKEQLVKAYTQMLLIRRFEEKAAQLYGMGLIGGFCHLYHENTRLLGRLAQP